MAFGTLNDQGNFYGIQSLEKFIGRLEKSALEYEER